MSSTTSSRRSHQTPKPNIIQVREASTDTRASFGTRASMDSRASKSTTTSDSRLAYYSSGQSSRSSMSSNYHGSSGSEPYHEPVVHKFRDYNSYNYEGSYKYSPSNKILVINHNAPSREHDPRLRSSNATHENYTRTQRSERRGA